jgi:general secretion pathway protein I
MRRPPVPARGKARPGLSLLEVLVALAIFLFSLIVIGKLITLGGDLALDVQHRNHAAQLCQSKLAEVVAGAVPLSAQSEVPFDEDPEWIWTMTADQGSVSGVWNVTVKVSRKQSPSGTFETSVSQMVLDPSLRGSSTDGAMAASTGTSDTTTNNATGSSSTQTQPTGQSATASPAPSSTPTGGGTSKPASTPSPAPSPTPSPRTPKG